MRCCGAWAAPPRDLAASRGVVGPRARAGAVRLRLQASPSSVAAGEGPGAWLSSLGDSLGPALGPLWERYTLELARSLADWTAPLLALALVAIITLLRAGRGKDDLDSEEEDGETGMMGLMFGGGRSKSPRLLVKSWNRQVDRYNLATTRATKGLEETQKLKQRLEEGYAKLQKRELAAPAKDAERGAAAAEKGAVVASPQGSEAEDSAPRRVWVLKFQGGRNDVTASGVQLLREEITATILAADPARDEVVLKLDSPGGTVTGYGLAGAQLMRLRDAGLRLTVAIDQVAASGGYLMACTADRIVCSPFAVIGSIGVVQELPIVFERLQREGINFETTTAGKYKRTLTPFKQPTEEDRKKNKEDIEDVLRVFKDFVRASRPSVDIEAVATGETWIGPLAKERGLVDELKTSDGLLLEHVRGGRQVLMVSLARQTGNTLQAALRGALDATGILGSRAASAFAAGGGAASPALARASTPTPMAQAPPGDWWLQQHGGWDEKW